MMHRHRFIHRWVLIKKIIFQWLWCGAGTLLFLLALEAPAVSLELVSSPVMSLQLKGSYKNLNFNTHRQSTGSLLEANLNRLRTQWDAKLLKIFSAQIIWDHELILGNYIDSELFQSRQLQRDQPYGDLEYELYHGNNIFYGQNFYRAFGELKLDEVNLRIGRQKIDWGIMRVFSPGDLFHPLPIFDIEKSERVGATAAQLFLTPWEETKINVVYAFDQDPDRVRLASRVTRTIGHFDLSGFGGKFLRDGIIGMDMTGDIFKAGIRGEFYYNDADQGDNFIQAAAGLDYGFANTLYLAAEYFHNGQGTNNPLMTPLLIPSAAQIRSVYKNFIGLQMKYDLTPLWTVSFLDIIDINGGSTFLNPETSYSLKDWLDFRLGAHFPLGHSSGEFTSIPNLYYFQTQMFF